MSGMRPRRRGKSVKDRGSVSRAARHRGGWVQSVIQPDGTARNNFQGFSADLEIGC